MRPAHSVRARRDGRTRTENTWWSTVSGDDADGIGHDAVLAHRGHLDDVAGLRRLHHLSVAQVEGHVLAAAGAPEEHVAAGLLGQRDPGARVVLVAAVVRQRDTDAGEGVDHQARAVETDLVVIAVAVGHAAVADAERGAVLVATAPGVGDAELRQRPVDHDLHRLGAGHRGFGRRRRGLLLRRRTVLQFGVRALALAELRGTFPGGQVGGGAGGGL